MDGISLPVDKPDVQALVRYLNDMISLHKDLLEVIRKEKEYVTKISINEINKVTLEKEALIFDIQAVENKRRYWVEQAAKFFEKEESDLTIEVVANLYGGDLYEPMNRLKQTLLVLIDKIREINLENNRIVEQALNESNTMKKNALGLTADMSKVYGPGGALNEKGDRSSRILSTEG